MVRERGLEPLCLAAVDFEPTTSTDSVTLAAGASPYQQNAYGKSLLLVFKALFVPHSKAYTAFSTVSGKPVRSHPQQYMCLSEC